MMFKKQPKESNKKSLVRIAVTLYVVLALVATIATFAWFTMNADVFIENARPGNIQIQVSSGDLKISLDPSNVNGEALIIKEDKPLQMIDVTGNGEKLLFPKNLNVSDEPVLDAYGNYLASNFDDVTGNELYQIELHVYFQTTSKMDVFLSKESYVSGFENLINDAFARQSLYGKFSCDGIAGAMRVAFLTVEDDGDSEEDNLSLRMVWAPNDNYYLSYAGGVASFKIDDEFRESKSGYKYLYIDDNGEIKEFTYTNEDYANGVFAVRSDQFANDGMINQSVPLFSFEKEGEVQTKELVIRIWVEGTDREADKALNGGMVKYNFSFVGIQKNESTNILASENEIVNGLAPENKIGIYYNTESKILCYCDTESNYNYIDAPEVPKDKILYSLDGILWHPYDKSCCEGNNALIQQGVKSSKIFIRFKETLTEKPGNVVTITIPKIEKQ